jgi:hypothetical protein
MEGFLDTLQQERLKAREIPELALSLESVRVFLRDMLVVIETQLTCSWRAGKGNRI